MILLEAGLLVTGHDVGGDSPKLCDQAAESAFLNSLYSDFVT